MKILIYSPMFHPSVGGLETIVSILADEFVKAGHEVRLACRTSARESDLFTFEVHRRISPYRLFKLTRWCDIFFQANVSLKGIWPLLISQKPLAISHNGWYARPDGKIGWQDRLKRRVARSAHNISVSHAVADRLSSHSVVIPNAYREDVFHLMPDVSRQRELVFLGRLVSDKGADILIESIALLKDQGIFPHLTIIGTGPEEHNLRQLAKRSGVDRLIEFAGLKTGEELARTLNEHQIMVVPSRLHEPFGIVALEGIACGCVVVGSEGGGLRDAIGPCGVTFPNGNARRLAQILSELITNEPRLSLHRTHAQLHLLPHRPQEVAKSYLRVFDRALN